MTKRELILEAAIASAKKVGVTNLTRDIVGQEANVSPSLVPFYLGNIEDMRRTILKEGYERGDVNLILQGVIQNDKDAWRAIKSHSERVAGYLFNR